MTVSPLLMVVGTRNHHAMEVLVPTANVVVAIVSDKRFRPCERIEPRVPLPDPTSLQPWGRQELDAFKDLVVEVVAYIVRNPRAHVLFACKGGKNRSRAVRQAVAKRLGILIDPQGCPADEELARLADMVFLPEYDSLAMWPTAHRKKRARET